MFRHMENKFNPGCDLLNIRNAFNSIKKSLIAEGQPTMGISDYIIRVIQEYLEGRTIVVETTEAPFIHIVNRGVLQGSVIGLILWNVAYDGILKIPYIRGIFLK